MFSLGSVFFSITITNSPLGSCILSKSSLAVPTINSSCILVSSLARTILLFFVIPLKSFNVEFSLCGASYNIIVLFDLFISSNFSLRVFLFNGKKPINVNSVASIPEAIIAVINAHAPGIGITFIFSFNASFTISSPGSDIAGVPASDTRAIFFPSFNSYIVSIPFSSVLCL